MSLNLTWIITLLIILGVFAGIAFCGWKVVSAIGNGFIQIIKMIFMRKN